MINVRAVLLHKGMTPAGNFELVVDPEHLVAEGGVLHHRQVVVQSRAQPHDIRCLPVLPGRSPLVLQRGDAAVEEVGINHLDCKPDSLEVLDPGACDYELLVLRVEVAPITAID